MKSFHYVNWKVIICKTISNDRKYNTEFLLNMAKEFIAVCNKIQNALMRKEKMKFCILIFYH